MVCKMSGNGEMVPSDHPDSSHGCSIKLAHLQLPVQSAMSCVQEQVHVVAKYTCILHVICV